MKHTVILSLKLLAYLLLCNCAFAAPATKADFVGTYHLDVSTFHGQTIPTNFYAFAITFNDDGSFVATNIPADFFITPTAATSQAKGTWKLTHDSDSSSDYLALFFTTTPIAWSWSNVVESYRDRPRIRMDYHTGNEDGAVFYLTKQK
jgi:hypothetical protein